MTGIKVQPAGVALTRIIGPNIQFITACSRSKLPLTEFQPAYSQLRADKYFSRRDQKKLSKTTLVIKFCKAVNVHLELRKNIHF